MNATEETYVFEAKGEFAKELKALVEKYSKEGKIKDKSVHVRKYMVMDYVNFTINKLNLN